MTKIEFKQFLGNYKTLNEIIKEIINKEYASGGWDYMNFHISNGRILASIWSGEDAEMMPDAIRQVDITKQVVEALMPDDLVF